MAEGDRLRALQMREAGHDGVGEGLGLRGQRELQGAQLAVDLVDGVAHPEAEIGRHLVVARARRVQPPGRIADQLAQARLDVHVDVFERARELEAALGDLRRRSCRGRRRCASASSAEMMP